MCYHFYMAHSEHEKYSYYFGSIQTLPNMLLWFMSEAVVVTPWKSEPLTATCREQSVSTRCPASSHGMLNKQSIYISHPLSSSLWNCFLSTQLCQKAAASSLFFIAVQRQCYLLSESLGCVWFFYHLLQMVCWIKHILAYRSWWLHFQETYQMLVKLLVAWNGQ